MRPRGQAAGVSHRRGRPGTALRRHPRLQRLPRRPDDPLRDPDLRHAGSRPRRPGSDTWPTSRRS